MINRIYRNSLKTMCEGPFVEDWEFQTVMGVSRDEMRSIHDKWEEPPTDVALRVVRQALNNLIGYPHGRMSKVEEMMGVPEPEMRIALNSILGRELR